jgi:hypothetical protein
MLNAIMLNVIVLSTAMLSAIMLNVVAPIVYSAWLPETHSMPIKFEITGKLVLCKNALRKRFAKLDM